MNQETVLSALVGMALAMSGWVYSRRIGVKAAQEQLAAANRDTISTLESRVRILEDNRTDCEERLIRAEQALNEWNDRLGQIWIRDFGEPK